MWPMKGLPETNPNAFTMHLFNCPARKIKGKRNTAVQYFDAGDTLGTSQQTALPQPEDDYAKPKGPTS